MTQSGPDKPGVLFLCTGNSARSQMAEALLRKEAGDHFEAFSAGSDPKGMNPLTVRVMEEIGCDLKGHRSKHLREYLGRLFVRVAVIVCTDAEPTCPRLWPGALQCLYWPFDDPAAWEGSEEERLAKFRTVRDQIHASIKEWLQRMLTAQPASADVPQSG